MQDWVVNLIIGLSSVVLGFVGGFFTKSYQVKIKQKTRGHNNKQNVEVNIDGKNN